MKLVKPNHPLLKQVIRNYDFNNPPPEYSILEPFDPIEFAHQLVKAMHDYNGIGLAANQVGYNIRAFAMKAHPENFVCFNPKIVQHSEEKIILDEGCLTYPGLSVKIKRSRHIRVRFQMPNSETVTKQFTGLTARIFQHELDHLDGVVFYTRANSYHREKAFKEWKKWKKEY